MREQKILNSVVILVVIVSFSASLWVSWLRAPHGAKSGSTAQMSQSVKMSQSVGHELKLISAILPILESEKRLHVCSWLHDGLSVYCADPVEAPRQLKRLEQAIVEEAARMQVYSKTGNRTSGNSGRETSNRSRDKSNTGREAGVKKAAFSKPCS